MTVEAGQETPEFDLPAAGGGRARLIDFKGKPLVVRLSQGRHARLYQEAQALPRLIRNFRRPASRSSAIRHQCRITGFS